MVAARFTLEPIALAAPFALLAGLTVWAAGNEGGAVDVAGPDSFAVYSADTAIRDAPMKRLTRTTRTSMAALAFTLARARRSPERRKRRTPSTSPAPGTSVETAAGSGALRSPSSRTAKLEGDYRASSAKPR
jgi:hypothetical protein